MRPFRFGVVRRYKTGPVAEMRVTAELTEREGGGTRLVYDVSARPRGAFGRAVIPVQIGRISARRFAEVFRHYDALALADRASEDDARPASTLSAAERDLLESLSRRLVEGGADAETVARLCETIERDDDLTLSRLRPYALADSWGAPRRDVLELCLKATRAGLLDLRWELLCPLCRGAGHSAEALADVHAEQHCDSCMIDFEVDFDRSVEVVFRPNASPSDESRRASSASAARRSRRTSSSSNSSPRARRAVVEPLLEEGRHRLRTHTRPEGEPVLVSRGGADVLTLRASGTGTDAEEPRVSTRPSIRSSTTPTPSSSSSSSARRGATRRRPPPRSRRLQLFRDLFAAEALRPGDRSPSGLMAILFTDLRNSTRLYREIGDAVAFGAVMNHFDVLREEIAREGGSIVKTLGDAVMAVFPRPAPALRAIISAQAKLAAPPAGVRPLTLKAGLHAGPCIAVTLNERLDYFGSNVNIAARLEPLSSGTDCVITSDVRRDPEVAALLEDHTSGLAAEPSEVSLKGFDDERFQLWRVKRKS